MVLIQEKNDLTLQLQAVSDAPVEMCLHISYKMFTLSQVSAADGTLHSPARPYKEEMNYMQFSEAISVIGTHFQGPI